MSVQIKRMTTYPSSRMFRLRPCATVSASFFTENTVMYVVDRVLVFAIIVMSTTMAAFLAWRGSSPLVAAEVVAGSGLTAAATVRMLSKAN